MKKHVLKCAARTVLLIILVVSVIALGSCSLEFEEALTLVGASINDNGELIITYSDGSTENLGSVVGKDGTDGKDGVDGKDGLNGKDGADGKNGIDGKDGKDGSDGEMIIIGAESDRPAAVAKGVRSTVSIVSKFRKTTSSFPSRPSTTTEYSASGSGVVYKLTDDGAFIITNYHVVYDSSNTATANKISNDISVFFYGGEYSEYGVSATYVGGSLYYDIAVLHVKSEDLPGSMVTPVSLGSSDAMRPGNDAIVIGNAQGYGISASVGVISVDSEYITMTVADDRTEVNMRVMRVDAAVNPGNSGGGLFDGEGNLIGIVNAKLVTSSVENIGYAIPSSVATAVADNIIHYCYGTEIDTFQRAMIDVTISTTSSSGVFDTSTGNIKIVETVEITEIDESSPAYGKLLSGDVVKSVTVGGKKISVDRRYKLLESILKSCAGDEIIFEIQRGDEVLTVSVTVTEECISSY